MAKKALLLAGKCALGGCVIVTFFDVVGHPAQIVGGSMEPTLLGDDARWWKRDYVWLSPWSTKHPKHGDILTFVPPRDPHTVHIKRVSAVENEFVRPQNREALTLIPPQHLWMESDNPENANDSNRYGPVSKGLIQGKAVCIIYPMSRWRVL